MKPSALPFARLAAAAMLLALPGCHKSDGSSAPAKSMASLLDYNARETARIVGAASDRPAIFDRMLVALGQPHPTMLWTAKLRVSQPFQCRTQTATMVRCFAALSPLNQDGVVGYADVMMYDHDITLADLLADRDRFDPPQPGQALHTATEPMYNPASDGSYSGPYATCRQALGPKGNGATTCFELIGARTALWTRLAPLPPSYTSEGAPNMDIRPVMVVTALDFTLGQLRKAEVGADGSFSPYQLPYAGGKMPFHGAGWYARNRQLFVKDLLYDGPYDDEAGCQADLARANLAYQQIHRATDMKIEGCQYYGDEPAGL